jgi:hypothetical protein
MHMSMLINDFLFVCMLLVYHLCYHHHYVFERERERLSEKMILGQFLAIRKPPFILLVFYF